MRRMTATLAVPTSASHQLNTRPQTNACEAAVARSCEQDRQRLADAYLHAGEHHLVRYFHLDS
jgi:hypothetical protein